MLKLSMNKTLLNMKTQNPFILFKVGPKTSYK